MAHTPSPPGQSTVDAIGTPRSVRAFPPFFGAPDSELFVCGMSLGHADLLYVANRLVTEREPVSGFARFLS